MKNYELLEAVGGIDPQYINTADQPAGRKRNGRIIRWIAVAACMCLAVGIVIPQLTNIFQNKGGSDHTYGTAHRSFEPGRASFRDVHNGPPCPYHLCPGLQALAFYLPDDT